MTPITQLLQAAHAGDHQAASQLLPLLYDELRQLAAARIAHEKPGQTLNATALVHEAYLRLVGDQQFEGRGHFFAAAAEAMRRILVEQARRRLTRKRGGGVQREGVELDAIACPTPDEELLALEEALQKFAESYPTHAELVKLRYFVGMTADQAAEVLGISSTTGDRYWAFARAWLRRSMEPGA
jgi:RNA polymerase sigma factor (TIGR02999 family)